MPTDTKYAITPDECERTIGHCWSGPWVFIPREEATDQVCRHCGVRSINRLVREYVVPAQ